MSGNIRDRTSDGDELTLFRASTLAEELEAAADARMEARRRLLNAQLDELARRRRTPPETP
jgi:hypothetical protein